MQCFVVVTAMTRRTRNERASTRFNLRIELLMGPVAPCFAPIWTKAKSLDGDLRAELQGSRLFVTTAIWDGTSTTLSNVPCTISVGYVTRTVGRKPKRKLPPPVFASISCSAYCAKQIILPWCHMLPYLISSHLNASQPPTYSANS